MEVEFINKEQDWANETTRYWFTVLDRCPPHDSYCIADCNGETTLLDREIYNALINERKNHV